jgi:hypothetical protein
MAWTTIPDARLLPDAPGRSVDALALRDNPIAIANGDAGAPNIQTAGIADDAVTVAKILDGDISKGEGWHGNVTRIKLAPQDFCGVAAADDYIMDETGKLGTIGIGKKIVGKVMIPTGFKATRTMIYCSNAIPFYVYENLISDNTNNLKSSSAVCNSEEVLTSVDSTTTNYLSILVYNNSAGTRPIYGGYVTIALI